MPPVTTILVVVAAFLASTAITAFLARFARRANLLDIPNSRSSHSTPTPRGGGLAIVVVSMLAVILLGATSVLDRALCAAFVGGGTLVATIGVWDDRFGAPPALRLCIHFVAAGWVVFCLGGMPPFDCGFGLGSWGFVGDCFAVVGLVWMINLTNFMDGIDGIAAAEGTFVAGTGALLLMLNGCLGLALASAVLAAATAGFLVLNWPPARIFLGDVGSGYLGFALGTLMLAHTWQRPSALWTWLILLSLFTADATITLTIRAIRRVRIYEAHRSHAYQHAARRWGHKAVTGAVIAINLVWLVPLAVLSDNYPHSAPLVYACAFGLLAAVAVVLRAGREGTGPKLTDQQMSDPSPQGVS
jgi:Fuc2NAc and GlcNAc transferase